MFNFLNQLFKDKIKKQLKEKPILLSQKQRVSNKRGVEETKTRGELYYVYFWRGAII